MCIALAAVHGGSHAVSGGECSGALALAVSLKLVPHVTLGAAWSPYPEALTDHTLRTAFPFSFSRHPMYTAMILYGTVAAWCVTLNWGFALL